MMKKKILVPPDRTYGDYYKQLENAGYEVISEPIHTTNRVVHPEQIKQFDYVICTGQRFTKPVLEEIKEKTKLIVKLGAGLDKIDLVTAEACGITVMNTPGRNARAVAEHAVALMLSQMRRVTHSDRKLRNDGCDREYS